MKIDRKLNLVIPIDRDDGTKMYVHSMPISFETFERYYLVIAKAFAALYSESLTFMGGPRIAALMIRDAALAIPLPGGGTAWEGTEGVERGLIGEMQRLTNLVALGDNGWQMTPYSDALKRGVIDREEASEVDGYVSFFMLNYWMQKRSKRSTMLDAAASLWRWQLTSSSVMEFTNSLTTLTGDTTTSQTEAA